MTRPLPAATDITYGQYCGWNCVRCGERLTTGAVSAGIARGASGAHVLDVEVYVCPSCIGPPPAASD